MPLCEQPEKVRRANEHRLVEQTLGAALLAGSVGLSWAQELSLEKKPHKNKWEQESYQLINMARSRKYLV